jgi:hypothetical protein
MDNEMKIKLDNATLSRGADGEITISKRGSCLTIGLLLGTAIVTLFGIFLTVGGVVQLFNNAGPGILLFGLFMTAMFGFFTRYLFSNARRGQITVVPVLNVVKIGNREIPFRDVATVDMTASPIPFMKKGVVSVKLLFTLTTGETIELGRIAMEEAKTEKIEKLKTEFTTLLLGTIRKN